MELTTLVIPGENDSEVQMEMEAKWISSLSPEIPLHLSRYFPRYRLEKPVTPVEVLARLQRIADKYLRHVYLGNV